MGRTGWALGSLLMLPIATDGCLAQDVAHRVGSDRPRASIPITTGQVISLAFTHDSRNLAVGAGWMTDRSRADLKLLDVGTGQILRELQGHVGTVPALAISPDEQIMISAGWADDRLGTGYRPKSEPPPTKNTAAHHIRTLVHVIRS